MTGLWPVLLGLLISPMFCLCITYHQSSSHTVCALRCHVDETSAALRSTCCGGLQAQADKKHIQSYQNSAVGKLHSGPHCAKGQYGEAMAETH